MQWGAEQITGMEERQSLPPCLVAQVSKARSKQIKETLAVGNFVNRGTSRKRKVDMGIQRKEYEII